MIRLPVNVPRARDYVNLVAKGWVVLLCATLLSVGAGWIAWQSRTPVYYSTARVFIVQPGGSTPSDAYYGDLSAESRTVTYQQLATSNQVTTRTIDQLGLDETPADLADSITVVVTNSVLLEVSVTADDGDTAHDVANAVTANMIQVSREIASLDSSGTELALVDSAGPAGRRGSYKQYMAIGGGLGLALGIVLVLANGVVRDKVLGRGQVDHIVDESA